MPQAVWRVAQNPLRFGVRLSRMSRNCSALLTLETTMRNPAEVFMAQKFAPCLFAVTLCLTLSAPALAWNDTGHQVVALIAYKALDDATQKKVQDILMHHPHVEEYLAKNMPAM